MFQVMGPGMMGSGLATKRFMGGRRASDNDDLKLDLFKIQKKINVKKLKS